VGKRSKNILKNLERLIEGEVLLDDLSRTIYSSGASLYTVRPLGIVTPGSKTDVVNITAFASQHNIPVTPRGGGASRAGNEVGEGLLLDFSKHMNGILGFDRKEKW
jgi:hypothetical protein